MFGLLQQFLSINLFIGIYELLSNIRTIFFPIL